MQIIAEFLQDESGATAIEYGLAEIALAIITVVGHIGTKLNASRCHARR